MKNDTNTVLYQYRGQYDRSFRLSDYLIDKVPNGFLDSKDNFSSILSAAKLILFGLAAIVADAVETSMKRKKLSSILRCSPEEIAMNVNELAEKRERVKYYGGDFTYSVATPKEWLKNIQMIFGEAHLEALDEMTCLDSLKSVHGNMYFSRYANCSDLKQLAFVRGNISCQGKRFSSLKEFHRFLQR